ncbi:MAG: GFA family protein [Gammaproteobacteria bacterium]|nr:GFA family protein [Gammaproteobacteria bacterium]
MDQNYVPVTGGCFCGAIHYQAEVNLYEAYYCHCQMCHKLSGTPAQVDVFVKPGTLRFEKEEPKYFQTSPFAKSRFCPNCGSRLVFIALEKEDWSSVMIGGLDHPEEVVPVEHICVENQLPWYKLADDLPRSRSEDNPDLVAAWAKCGLTHDGKPR